MAGLLDRLNAGGAKVLQALEAIATPNVYGDPAMEAMMSEEQRAAAKGYARSVGIAGMQEAAQKNLPWYALGSARDIKAMPAYRQYLDSAVASVDELRKRRDSEGRRDKVAELVARLSNPEDPLSQEYTPEQIALLGTLTPDEQAALMAKKAFPKESGISIASAGSIQKVMKLANGNIGVVVQTGDPSKPAVVNDLGTPYISELPSDIRSLIELGQRPELIDTARRRELAESTGAKTGEANVAVLKEVPAIIATNQRHIEQLSDLRNRLAGLDSGALTGRVLQQFSADFQTAQALMYEEALLQIGALKAAGASLNPITEKELEVLFTTSPKLTNRPEANLKIIDERIKRVQRLQADLQQQVAAARAGDVTQYDPTPGAAPYSPPPGPGQPVPAPAPQRVPQGGPSGGVSVIPTIRKPGQ